MQYEPTTIFECDECGTTEALELSYVFTDYSGDNGYYTDEATSDASSLKIQLETDFGWSRIDADDSEFKNDSELLFCDDSCRCEYQNKRGQ